MKVSVAVLPLTSENIFFQRVGFLFSFLPFLVPSSKETLAVTFLLHSQNCLREVSSGLFFSFLSSVDIPREGERTAVKEVFMKKTPRRIKMSLLLLAPFLAVDPRKARSAACFC